MSLVHFIFLNFMQEKRVAPEARAPPCEHKWKQKTNGLLGPGILKQKYARKVLNGGVTLPVEMMPAHMHTCTPKETSSVIDQTVFPLQSFCRASNDTATEMMLPKIATIIDLEVQ